jgi:arsenate reductase
MERSMPDAMPDNVYNVLFLCANNSARSILAEAILNRDGEGRFRAYSAGCTPNRQVEQDAVALLQRLGFDTARLRSKSWDEFAAADAPAMDFVFTVCDDAAGEVCPVWTGHPVTAHWGIEDPCLVKGDAAERAHAFEQALHYLENRISLFINLPIEKLDAISLKAHVTEIGQIEGASALSQ